MSTVTIPRPDVTTEDVAAALRKGLRPRYQVKPGMRTSLLPGHPTPAGPGGLSALRLVNTIVIAPRVRRTLRTAFAV